MNNIFEKEAMAAVKADSYEDTCLKCAFCPNDGSPLCLAPWPDIMLEDGKIDSCYEGVYCYLSGAPGPRLKEVLDRRPGTVGLRRKGERIRNCSAPGKA